MGAAQKTDRRLRTTEASAMNATDITNCLTPRLTISGGAGKPA